ncbi:MAG: methylated-DNA--[protein]-cysteine S-methyltransferase, partial [Magnetovibrio sp.]|nr:methylated-DNA--[protein]-cysteine S-methyltransferase [Magnetovibrio sp.]
MRSKPCNIRFMETLCIKSPLGDLTLFEDAGNIIALDWGRGLEAPRKSDNGVLNDAKDALMAYFKTGQENFKALPLDPDGTKHQKAVWKTMQAIHPGNVKTYGEVAKSLKSSAQAVGNACGANPIPILIPCHRIIGQNNWGGYSGDG